MNINSKKGETLWKSPSNIALVKYWGKYGNQLPQNPSISFTLSNAYTLTNIRYQPKTQKDDDISLKFLFQKSENPLFEQKIKKFLTSVINEFPFLKDLHLQIESENSFPHSTGIASSASSMSALALCLCQMERELTGHLQDDKSFYRKASFIARLGSGSACRSVFPYLVLWGQIDSVELSANEYAIPVYENIDAVFKNFNDSILIISAEEKSVSSRAGHALMEGNPYASARYQQASQNVEKILQFMKEGNIEEWGKIVEKEALTLHALMMASEPPYILMQPNTLIGIEKIKDFRQQTGVPLYFTLDAGPNIHLLYPDSVNDKVIHFIEEELVYLCEDRRVIHDKVGMGPQKIN